MIPALLLFAADPTLSWAVLAELSDFSLAVHGANNAEDWCRVADAALPLGEKLSGPMTEQQQKAFEDESLWPDLDKVGILIQQTAPGLSVLPGGGGFAVVDFSLRKAMGDQNPELHTAAELYDMWEPMAFCQIVAHDTACCQPNDGMPSVNAYAAAGELPACLQERIDAAFNREAELLVGWSCSCVKKSDWKNAVDSMAPALQSMERAGGPAFLETLQSKEHLKGVNFECSPG